MQTRDHGRIHYLEAGSGAPLIFMHTNGHSAYEYHDMMGPLAARNRVIAWDQPGHGDSEPITRHYSVDDYADALVAFMDALGIRQANVFGASIGGTVAVSLGVRHADRIDSLFVVEAPFRTPAQWLERWPATEAGYGTVTQTFEQVAPRLRHLTQEEFARWNIDRSKAGAWAMMDVMWALRDYDVHAALPNVRTRTMVIYGDKTPHRGALAAVGKAIPGAVTAEIANCGHFPMMDDPAGVAAIIDRFIHERG